MSQYYEEAVNLSENIKKSDQEWRKQLNDEQYFVTRQKGTERPFTGEYNKVVGFVNPFCR